MELTLMDDFTILKNESGGMRDYYHEFQLKISDQDVTRLLKNNGSSLDVVTVSRKQIDSNVWKEVRINVRTSVLTDEYIVN